MAKIQEIYHRWSHGLAGIGIFILFVASFFILLYPQSLASYYAMSVSALFLLPSLIFLGLYINSKRLELNSNDKRHNNLIKALYAINFVTYATVLLLLYVGMILRLIHDSSELYVKITMAALLFASETVNLALVANDKTYNCLHVMPVVVGLVASIIYIVAIVVAFLTRSTLPFGMQIPYFFELITLAGFLINKVVLILNIFINWNNKEDDTQDADTSTDSESENITT